MDGYQEAPARWVRVYRAFEKGAVDNQDHESAKLAMPVLSIGGANSRLNKYVIDQLRAGTTRLTGDLAPQSGHWIPEEQPGVAGQTSDRVHLCQLIHALLYRVLTGRPCSKPSGILTQPPISSPKT